MRKLIVFAWFALCLGLAQGREAQPTAEDPVLEARVQAVAEELRCLVCQNQNLADSHAELAIDLKNQVREMFQRGMSEKQVVEFMVQRYGDFVLYRPPVKQTTWLLWFGPFLLFAGGLGVLFVKLRNRRSQLPKPLSQDEKNAATQLLDSDRKESA
ncbi:cytochrome c-type biogenesis protein [Denitratisoma oestradiolicum]|uniref:Cytochrome c-type biogenesis protein n=1 Tax=Denitratisoma oestradiolicum TaxID=311182 RepID=A0A6S6XSI4_9PROT|nr:cytochrome c-type biogenesis protein [Denitratisoma oestradiolicum]TWO80607.1 cytochrome C biogenesis protein [Denitratisoma oestradiolicum]CAB1367685.1 Cytochrome c-type biogenesis protein CcmH [Denitratisoma oestradiolicum]